MQETVPDRDPFERLQALQAKAQEVLVLGGWKSGSKFGSRVAKILERTSNEANLRRTGREGYENWHECEHPDHWDWQAYLVSFKCLILYTDTNLRKVKPMNATIEMTHVWLLNKFFSVSNVGSKSTHETVENLPASISLDF